ncbi:MAG: methionyl-tRNA formyltransferase [Treponema sp.]|nr:methionyl-tRNA formyltransferase [Treponema sp.]MCL2271295.1 methionyl-tRNA formyltransferase [Treponema sp.]
MRLLFAGSPAISVPSLETLGGMKEGFEIAGVLTNPDSPKGRHGNPVPTDVGEAAVELNRQFEEQGGSTFPILKPAKLDEVLREQIKSLKPDLLISFAYGHIFGPKFMALFPLGGINIHPSLLPEYRGPSPVQASILNRDSVTGITVQTIEQEVDSGNILAARQLQLTGRETAGSLSRTVSLEAALMLPAVLREILAGNTKGTPQDHKKASYCCLVKKEDGFIDWKKSAAEIEAKVRAFNPWPLCRTIHNGRELFILESDIYSGGSDCPQCGLVLGIDKKSGILVQTGKGALAVTCLQYQAKKALFWQEFLNGARDFTGSILGYQEKH